MFPPLLTLSLALLRLVHFHGRETRPKMHPLFSGIDWAASLCPKEGNFLQFLTVWVLPVTIRIPKLRSGLHSLPLALVGQ